MIIRPKIRHIYRIGKWKYTDVHVTFYISQLDKKVITFPLFHATNTNQNLADPATCRFAKNKVGTISPLKSTFQFKFL